MEEKRFSFLRTKILEFMAKYIGIDDLGYVVAIIISGKRTKELKYEIINHNLKDTYAISIKLSKEE